MGNSDNKMNKLMKPFAWVFSILVLGLSLGGLYHVQSPDTKGILIASAVLAAFFIIYLLALVFVKLSKRKSADNYDINGASSGKDNKAFEGEGKSVTGGDVKWVSNYVPYGDFPKGTNNAVNSVDIVDEKKQNGVEKWQKNYVPYEEEEDSNKKE